MSDLTIGDVLVRAYGNLAMASAAMEEGAETYTRKHYMIRARLTSGLSKGTMSLGSLKDDERVKLNYPKACCYCGAQDTLTLDHLLPRHLGGEDSGDNLVWACRSCNSSKGHVDVLAWYARKEQFPPLLLLRRYLKLAIRYCDTNGIMSTPLDEKPALPFDLDAVPRRFPYPPNLRQWIVPMDK